VPAHHDSLRQLSCACSKSAASCAGIAREVDPFLEITGDLRSGWMRAGGPALLFEHVKGSRFPLLINTYATRRRMSWALGVGDLEQHARTIGELVRSQPPTGLMDKIRMLPKLARVASATPRNGEVRALSGGRRHQAPTSRRLPIITCWPDDGGPLHHAAHW